MKNLFLLIAISLFPWLFAQAQAPEQSIGQTPCTSILAGKLATVDGSVMTSHTCDSWYRTWMELVPAKDHADGEKEAIYTGRMHTEHAGDSAKVKEVARIPQVKHTYRFLDTAYPCMNEKQLAIGETTISGRDTLRNSKGAFMIEELCRVALERCTTAREAILLMDKLTKEYGYGDSGECLTIADPNEAWYFEIFGAGPKKLGAVWAAVRIPDDEVAVSANISRISKVDANDKDNCLLSDNAFDVARKLKLWDGKEEFCWWRVFSGGNYFGEKKNYSIREHYILSQLAPSLNLSDTIAELPLSVKPEEKLTVRRMNELLGSYFEGTKLCLAERLKIPNTNKKNDNDPDSIVSPLANPWLQSAEATLMKSVVDNSISYQRTVSVPWCAYSTIIQCRSWLPDEVGCVVWMALDNPGQSPRFPIFAGQTQLPAMLSVCGQHRDRDDAALWYYRKANRLATVKWGTFRKTLEPARDHFIYKGELEMPFVEQICANKKAEAEKDQAGGNVADILNGYSADFFGATINRWDGLARKFWRDTWGGF